MYRGFFRIYDEEIIFEREKNRILSDLYTGVRDPLVGSVSAFFPERKISDMES